MARPRWSTTAPRATSPSSAGNSWGKATATPIGVMASTSPIGVAVAFPHEFPAELGEVARGAVVDHLGRAIRVRHLGAIEPGRQGRAAQHLRLDAQRRGAAA